MEFSELSVLDLRSLRIYTSSMLFTQGKTPSCAAEGMFLELGAVQLDLQRGTQ